MIADPGNTISYKNSRCRPALFYDDLFTSIYKIDRILSTDLDKSMQRYQLLLYIQLDSAQEKAENMPGLITALCSNTRLVIFSFV